jgi:eukaryotic-like serine/threonine-protein kinase
MGTVYQAIDLRTRALAAVKILAVRNISDVGRFDQEATLLQELSHPGIVRYVDHGLTLHGDPYIAMEWLEGETLDERLGRGKLAPAGVAHLAGRVLDALAAAHEHGIVHRDIKPSNLFLAGWRLFDVRIIDFGVARRVEDPKRYTRRGSTVGTPSYSSPEQARGEADIDGRADIFSLGCVLFECLTGRPPFHGPSPKEVLNRICLTPVPSLADRREDLDEDLVRLIDSMLVQDRQRRPADGRALAVRFRDIATRLGAAVEAVSAGAGDPADQAGGAVGRGHPPAGLSLEEARVRCGLVLAYDSQTAAVDPDAELEHIGKEIGLSAEMVSSFTRMIWLRRPGSVSDQVHEMIRAASRLRAVLPGARQAVAIGRASVVAGSMHGPLCESLTALLPEQAGTVRLDETVARLIPLAAIGRGPGSVSILRSDEGADASLIAVDSREPPLTGRERELERLMESLAECVRSDSAHVAIYEGGAGLGKTRLARALVSEARRAVPAPGAPPSAAGGPAWAASYLLRGRRERTAEPYAFIKPLLLPDARLGDAAPAAARQAAFVEHLSALLERQPVLLVCDDLQWADAPSVRLLAAALRELRQRPLLLVGFGRPELFVESPSPLFERALSYERMRLPPLSHEVGQSLLRWHRGRTTADVETYVFDRWQGNPFYLAELALVAARETLLAPDTVLGEVEPLLAGLDEEPRRVLRAASLLGDTFEFEGVLSLLGLKGRRALEETLATLVDGDLIRRLGASSGSFAFRNKLVRESAFSLLTGKDRQVGIARARQWLEEAGKTIPELLLEPSLRRRAPAVEVESTGAET